jgi:hypothetical protein
MLAWFQKRQHESFVMIVVNPCYNAMYQVETVLMIREALTMIKCTLPDQQLMWGESTESTEQLLSHDDTMTCTCTSNTSMPLRGCMIAYAKHVSKR